MEAKAEAAPGRGLRRRLFLVALTLVAVVMLVVVLITIGGSDDGEEGASSDTSLPGLGFPDPESRTANADLEYLEGDGQALLVVHEQAKAFLKLDGTADQCREAAERLDDLAPADEVLSLIGNITDAVLGSALHAERTSLGVELTRCISGESATENEPPDLEQTVEAVEVRLGELVAAR